jgi:hypothetical protein
MQLGQRADVLDPAAEVVADVAGEPARRIADCVPHVLLRDRQSA